MTAGPISIRQVKLKAISAMREACRAVAYASLAVTFARDLATEKAVFRDHIGAADTVAISSRS